MSIGDAARGLREEIFALGTHIRYVALADGQAVDTAERDGLSDASSDRSDFFEELLVNPALLTLATQRGELDCGGLRYVQVGYGSFRQIIVPLTSGHVSVCVENDAPSDEVAAAVLALAAQRGLGAGRR